MYHSSLKRYKAMGMKSTIICTKLRRLVAPSVKREQQFGTCSLVEGNAVILPIATFNPILVQNAEVASSTGNARDSNVQTKSVTFKQNLVPTVAVS
jgi:hypothetical protein